jgi:hypothetical protein
MFIKNGYLSLDATISQQRLSRQAPVEPPCSGASAVHVKAAESLKPPLGSTKTVTGSPAGMLVSGKPKRKKSFVNTNRDEQVDKRIRAIRLLREMRDLSEAMRSEGINLLPRFWVSVSH